MLNKIETYFELVKFSHTIFALPFALASLFMVEKGIPPLDKTFWIVLAIVFARTAGMAFNRYIDLPIDRLNPRSKKWVSVSGKVKPWEILLLGVVSSVAFIYTTYNLNLSAFYLSPVVILLLLLYPIGKRFTNYVHLILGLVYFFIPLAVSIALKGEIYLSMVSLGLAMAFWVSGFDILYALQDLEFDRRFNVHSLPAKLGVEKSIKVARLFHTVTFIFTVVSGFLSNMGVTYYIGVTVLAIFLIYEHSLIKESDLSKINKAFFTVNGFISIIFFVFVILDVFLGGT
ncbi:MAG: putative 4-hydroxybenzoate polyprenyltransferase [Hydrogenothermaceae bacterium]|nr:putative 4-hydroxybenzoate polyprenyltransferase [Hydrogenothermaceae bacterium]